MGISLQIVKEEKKGARKAPLHRRYRLFGWIYADSLSPAGNVLKRNFAVDH